MIDFALFDRRPIVVAVAGPNGAGKTTFCDAHLRPAGLRHLNANLLARELDLGPYAAQRLADSLRRELVRRGESFVFETVFSDPVGEKVRWLRETTADGYHVVLCYVGISGTEQSEERVAMRVSQGGHDVPTEKLRERFPRSLANLARSVQGELPHVLVFDNSDIGNPFRRVAVFENGHAVEAVRPAPAWLATLIG